MFITEGQALAILMAALSTDYNDDSVIYQAQCFLDAFSSRSFELGQSRNENTEWNVRMSPAFRNVLKAIARQAVADAGAA